MADVTKLYDSFYGTYNHYQRIGWFFDKIVADLEDLEDCLNILTGRFVLVENEDAIFMRAPGVHEYTRFVTGQKAIDVEDSDNPIEIEGFKFVAYATQKAKLLLDSNGDYISLTNDNQDVPYKIAKDSYIKAIGRYYFPSDKNADRTTLPE